MNRIVFLLVAAAVGLFSCDPEGSARSAEGSEHRGIAPGTYKGTFIRSSPNARYQPSAVTMTFTLDAFKGSGELPKYPALCEGTYAVDGGTIKFTDKCIWTADFDWSLILNGEYILRCDARQVEFERVQGDVTDHYRLVLQE